MFEIKIDANQNIWLSGRWDASQVEKANNIFEVVNKTCQVSFEDLDYISSAGLGVLLVTQKRLSEIGHELLLRSMNKHIREVFKYAGFDMIFKIE